MDTPTLSQLRVRLLGGVEVRAADGADLTPPGRKLRALVALLALAPAGGWSRERLMALLWDRRDEEQARGSLRQALTELRRTLGEAALISDREVAALSPQIVDTDVAAFERLAAAGDLTGAASLYRGDLLDGVGLPDGDFADWLLVERTRLHDTAVRVLAGLLETQHGASAVTTARRLLQLDPLREDTHRALMQLYAAQGDRAQALRQYQLCRDVLQRELGVSPEPETERLFRELPSMRGRATPAAAAEARPRQASAEESPAGGGATPRRTRRLAWAAAAAAVGALAVVAGVRLLSPATESGTVPMVAVLPFSDLGGDPSSGRLADGLTQEIITDLARFPEFRVIARNSVEAFKGKAVDVRQVGAALGVGFVVEGSIQREAGRVRITAQLIDAGSGDHLWSERWDRADADLFAVQAELATQIANRLGGGAGLIQETGRIAAHRKPPDSLTAYELYLLGTEKLEQVNRADLEDALRLLTQAVEIDPGLARAWIELSHTHGVLAGFGVDPENNRNLGLAAAERAVKLDPSDAEAHAVLGSALGDRNDFARAKAEFDLALRLAPGAAEILTFYLGWASTFGEPERGAAMVDDVVRLDPNYPMWANRLFTYAYFMAGRYEDAVRMLQRLAAENYSPTLWAMRVGALAALGRSEEAKAALKQALDSHPEMTIESIANEPGYSQAERERFIETMRLAAFPACAGAGVLAKLDEPVRLAECLAQK